MQCLIRSVNKCIYSPTVFLILCAQDPFTSSNGSFVIALVFFLVVGGTQHRTPHHEIALSFDVPQKSSLNPLTHLILSSKKENTHNLWLAPSFQIGQSKAAYQNRNCIEYQRKYYRRKFHPEGFQIDFIVWPMPM